MENNLKINHKYNCLHPEEFFLGSWTNVNNKFKIYCEVADDNYYIYRIDIINNFSIIFFNFKDALLVANNYDHSKK